MRRCESGFTLIEVIIALLISSIIVVSIAVGLRQVIMTKSVVDRHQSRLESLQKTMILLSRDIMQSIDRVPAEIPGRDTEQLLGTPNRLAFIRRGNINPLGVEDRSELQWVSYAVINQELVRTSRDYTEVKKDLDLNRSQWLLPAITPVGSLPIFQYVDDDNQFHSNWPAPTLQHQGLPKAIQVTFAIPGWGNISRLLMIQGERYEENYPT